MKRHLTLLTLTMLNIAAIASLRGLPSMAEYGLSSIFYYLFAAVLFFVPTSLISAELASGWPQKGGVYLWVKEAFGPRLGFVAIWLQWIQNVIWYPTVLSFAAASLAYLISPDLARNNLYTIAVILAVYWLGTFLTFRGISLAGLIGSWGVILGTLIPGAIIIILAVVWLLQGNPSATPLVASAAIPDLSKFANLVLAISIFLSFAGMEMNAVHITETKNPEKNYPRAIFIAMAVILSLFIMGTLAIAVVVPQSQISLTAGIMQAYEVFLHQLNVGWAVPILAVLLVFGAFGSVITWIAGPSKGLLEVGKSGYLPPFLQRTNKQGVQTHILIVQGCIVTVLSLAFVFMPNVSSAYFLLSALTVQLYLIMYIIMFVSALKLRRTQPQVKRAYRVPLLPLVGGTGLVASVVAISLGFVPPAQLSIGTPVLYVAFLVIGIIIFASAPFIIYRLKKTSWKQV